MENCKTLSKLHAIVWECQEKSSVWVPYSPEVVCLIEDGHKNGKNIVNIGQVGRDLSAYKVDLQAMIQTTLDYEPIDAKINSKVSLWEGDITKLEVDAIVNAANNALLGGGGVLGRIHGYFSAANRPTSVNGCIHRAAGLTLKEECRTKGGCETGDAKITSGHKLPAKYVIHTSGPSRKNEEDLRSCYEKCLKLTLENNIRTLAFSCISTGVGGYPNEDAAEVALSTTRKWLEKNADEVDRIIFCLFSVKDIEIYQTLMLKYFPPWKLKRPDKQSEEKETSETKCKLRKADKSEVKKGRKTGYLPEKEEEKKEKEGSSKRDWDKYQEMPLEEKRKLYECGNNFIELKDIEKWPNYFKNKNHNFTTFKTGTVRPIRRTVYLIYQRRSTGIVWERLHDHGWKPYDTETAHLIEKAYKSKASTIDLETVIGIPNVVDLQKMVQINKKTSVERRVQRKVLENAIQYPMDDGHVEYEEILQKLEESMQEFVGLESLKEQFLRFAKTQLQNDRRRLFGHNANHKPHLHLVFAGNPGTGKTTFARRVAELLYSIKKTKENKVIEVQRSDLVGEYIGATAKNTKAKIEEAKGGVLFIDEAYRLIPSSERDFGKEAIEELMSVMEDGDPVMIFAGYEAPMEKFIKVNPGLQSRINRKFVFPDYSIEELGEIFRQQLHERKFRLASDTDVDSLLRIHTTEKQRASMNARLARILLNESIEEASNRAPMDASLHELLLIKQTDIAAACARLSSITSDNDTADSP